MSGPRPSLTTRAEMVDGDLARRRKRAARPVPHGDAEYAAALERETEASLRRSPRWRAGRALEDHRDACDCPLTLAGCWERRAWPTSDGLGSRSGVPPHGGRWPR